MDTTEIIIFLKEFAFLITTFGVFLLYAMAKGKYSLINVIFALYLALLISIEFPYYDKIGSGGAEGGAMAKILLFIAIVVAGVMLFRRHIPGDDYEPAFHGFGKKVLLASMATILVMTFSFHALPVTDIITPGSPIQSLFAPEQHFFWWLTLPLIALFFV
jgi:hypothetical protein